MKILLVIPRRNPKTILPALDIGVAFVGRAILDSSNQVEVLDCHKEGYEQPDFENHIRKHSYDLIGFKFLTIDARTILNYCRAVKKISPDTITLAGGPHPSSIPEYTLKSIPYLDYILVGEAELGMKILLKTLSKSRTPSLEDLKKVSNLVYRKNDGSISINAVRFEENLDAIGFPAWELFDVEKYPSQPGSGRYIPIITTRGCPGTCTFCCSNSVFGRELRFRTASNIIEEIHYLMETYLPRRISIFDNNFTTRKSFVLEFCELFLETGLKVAIDIPQGIRLDSVDIALIRALRRIGCDYVGVGIESGSDETLQIIKKKINTRMIREKIDIIKKVGKMKVIGFFVIGFPHETADNIQKTIDFALSLNIDYATFTIFTPFPGTELFDELVSKGVISLNSISWEDLSLDSIIFPSENISPEELKNLQKKAYFRFYFRFSKVPFFFKVFFLDGAFISYLKRLRSITGVG